MPRSKRENNAMKKCGIIMPISLQRFGQIEYPPEYWDSMLVFLKKTIKKSGYEPVPMWEDSMAASITPRIVKNIAEFPLSVCVISAFNPNVMIELGMRLSCNKPVLVIFDENTTTLPFDIKDLEAYQIPSHPIYNQYDSIGEKIGEYLHKMDNPDYKPFLDNISIGKVDKIGVGKINNGVDAMSYADLNGRVTRLEAQCAGVSSGWQSGPTGPSPVIEGRNAIIPEWVVGAQ